MDLRYKKIFIVSLISILFGIFLISFESKENANIKLSQSEFLLDTYVDITIYGNDDENLFNEIFEEIRNLENLLSVHIEGSDLYKLKENAGISPVKVSQNTMFIIEKSLKYSRLTDGLFDITSGPLINLWDIGSGNEKVPSEEKIQKSIKFIDYTKIKIDKDKSTVFLKEKGMSADLGAIAKGYIADKAKEKMLDLGINSGIINLGGNVLLINSKPDGSNFRIGIQDPDEERGGNIGVYEGVNTTIVSSGDYERYFIEDGVRYHHILNPKTGYPVDTEIKSVSIITENSFEADALSTSVLLLGWDKGIDIIENSKNAEAIFINKNHEVYVTQDLKDNFEFTSKNYTLINTP